METHREHTITPRKVFLEALKKTGIIERACKEANLSRTTFYRWVDNDPDFGASVFESMYVAYETNWQEMDKIPRHKRNSFLHMVVSW